MATAPIRKPPPRKAATMPAALATVVRRPVAREVIPPEAPPRPIVPTTGAIVRAAGSVGFEIGHGMDWTSLPQDQGSTQILRVECAGCLWGQLLIACEAVGVLLDAVTVDAGASEGTYNLAIEDFPYVEIRVVAWTGGIAQVWFEGAVGDYAASEVGGSEKSSGPICLPFAVGEVPDVLEVFGRVSYGGAAAYPASAGLLNTRAVSRFHT